MTYDGGIQAMFMDNESGVITERPSLHPRQWRCPYCRGVFRESKGRRCPACGRALRFPRRFLMPPDDIERQRLVRMARDRHNERQALRRKAMRSLGLSRRSWLIMALAALVLLGVLLPYRYAHRNANSAADPSKEVRAVQSLWALRTALEGYRDDCGRYPLPEEGLPALVQAPDVSGWRGPYIDLLRPDPWHVPFHYSESNGTVVLYSSGPDRRDGTPDDLIAPRPDYTLLKQRNADTHAQRYATPPSFSVRLKE